MITEAMGIQVDLVYQETVTNLAKTFVRPGRAKNHQMVTAGGDSLKFSDVLLGNNLRAAKSTR